MFCQRCSKKVAKLQSINDEVMRVVEKYKIIRFMKEVCSGEKRRKCSLYLELNGIKGNDNNY